MNVRWREFFKDQCEAEAAIDYPADIALLRRAIPELATATDHQIQEAWRGYSAEQYRAGWTTIGNHETEFRDWLEFDRPFEPDTRYYDLRPEIKP